MLIEKFVDPSINLSNKPVLNEDGSEKLEALDNHTMGTLFEEVIRMFNEQTNVTDAGRHFTPRDIIELMADLAFIPIQDKIQSTTYRIYDGACGTGGMLTVGESCIQNLAERRGKKVSINLFGQENFDETYAIACADMLLKGEGTQVNNIFFGSTISNDGFPKDEFDFMLSNPPFGTSWKAELKAWGDIKKDEITDSRFLIEYDGNPEYSLIPDIGDPQMLFLANNISKMKRSTDLGSRIIEVHNSSSISTGGAGSGTSNLRRFIIENDLLEAIVALPQNMFYNTGISTYLWIVTNKKEDKRKGYIQLIDASELKASLRKNVGEKNCEITPKIRRQIIDLYLAYKDADSKYSMVFKNEEFGYYLATVNRPLRLKVEVSTDRIELLRNQLKDEGVVEVLNKYCEDQGDAISYLHLFDVTQADLNWKNPEVREELKEVIRFWKAKGVKGFRFDVVNLISKPEIWEDDFEGDGRKFYTDGPYVHEYLKELVRDTGIEDYVTVGEMSSTTLEHCIRYSGAEEKELSMCFNFHHLKVDYKDGNKWELMEPDYMELKVIFEKWQMGMQRGNAWNALFWCNHDQPRIVSRFGNEGEYWKESAKMLAGMIHLMRGTPYIYQGEEIGMTNPHYTSIEQYADVESRNYYEILLNEGKTKEEALEILAARSRDNSRTPMQWTDERYCGFSDTKPWIPVSDNFEKINVKKQKQDRDSILEFYKKLIMLRKEKEVIARGNIEFMEVENAGVLAYTRCLDKQKLLVCCNFRDVESQMEFTQEWKSGRKILGNYEENHKNNYKVLTLRPYEIIVLEKGEE